MPEHKDPDGIGSNVWDFLQTFFSNPAVIKTTGTFVLAGGVLVAIAQGWLDGHQLVDWFKQIWQTLKGGG